MNSLLPQLIREVCRRRLLPDLMHAKAPGDLRDAPALQALADKLEPALRRAFLAAVRKLQANIDLEKLAQAIAANQLTSAEAAAKLATFPEAYGELSQPLRAGFLAGAGLGLRQLAQQGIELRFDLINPHAVRYAETTLLKIVPPFKEDAKELIREFLARSLRGEMPPSGAAKDIKDLIGLDPQRVRRADAFWQELVDKGKSEEDIQRRVAKKIEALTRERAETIARTEIHRAAQEGELAAWEEAADKGLFNPEEWVKIWVVTWDEALCPKCEPMDGQMVGLFDHFTVDADGVAIDNGFGEAVDAADAHVNCRCSIVRVRADEADAYVERLNRPDEKPQSRR